MANLDSIRKRIRQRVANGANQRRSGWRRSILFAGLRQSRETNIYYSTWTRIDSVAVKPFLQILRPIPNATSRVSEIARAGAESTPALERTRLDVQDCRGFRWGQHTRNVSRGI